MSNGAGGIGCKRCFCLLSPNSQLLNKEKFGGKHGLTIPAGGGEVRGSG